MWRLFCHCLFLLSTSFEDLVPVQPVVFCTDRSKAVALLLFGLCKALWPLLHGESFEF